MLRGSLAPDGAIIKTAALADPGISFTGRAVVFPSEREALVAVSAGTVVPGDVLVLPGLGPRGGPGTVFAAGLVAALVGAGLSGQVAVVTDGELSGLNSGLTVGQVMPEAADGGPVGLVRDGDSISIDLMRLTIDLLVPDSVLEERRAGAPLEPAWMREKGLLRLYGATVGPLKRGAVMGYALQADRDT